MEDRIYELFLGGKNILIHGPSGTGKSYTINLIIDLINRTDQANTIIAAPTGAAAIHIGGSTIHSQFNIPCYNVPEKIVKNIGNYDYTSKNNNSAVNDFITKFTMRSGFNEKNLKYLIIDEISMVGASLLTILDGILREKYEHDLPMGGVQCIFSGDFYQLPPVKDEYCCFTETWNKMNIVQVKFKESKRYDGEKSIDYFDFICRLRKGNLLAMDTSLIKSRIDAYNSGDHLKFEIKPIRLFPTNRDIDTYNARELALITNEEFVFKAVDNIRLAAGLTRNESFKCQQEAKSMLDEKMVEELHLKIDAQVIFTSNYDVPRKLVNGRMAKIIAITQDQPELAEPNLLSYSVTVRDYDGCEFVIRPTTWTNNTKKYSCSRIQFPFKLAWAISIHRSQGMTIDKAVIDISRSFCAGQSYVAISRVKNIDGLFIVTANMKKIYADPRILEKFH